MLTPNLNLSSLFLLQLYHYHPNAIYLLIFFFNKLSIDQSESFIWEVITPSPSPSIDSYFSKYLENHNFQNRANFLQNYVILWFHLHFLCYFLLHLHLLPLILLLRYLFLLLRFHHYHHIIYSHKYHLINYIYSIIWSDILVILGC